MAENRSHGTGLVRNGEIPASFVQDGNILWIDGSGMRGCGDGIVCLGSRESAEIMTAKTRYYLAPVNDEEDAAEDAAEDAEITYFAAPIIKYTTFSGTGAEVECAANAACAELGIPEDHAIVMYEDEGATDVAFIGDRVKDVMLVGSVVIPTIPSWEANREDYVDGTYRDAVWALYREYVDGVVREQGVLARMALAHKGKNYVGEDGLRYNPNSSELIYSYCYRRNGWLFFYRGRGGKFFSIEFPTGKSLLELGTLRVYTPDAAREIAERAAESGILDEATFKKYFDENANKKVTVSALVPQPLRERITKSGATIERVLELGITAYEVAANQAAFLRGEETTDDDEELPGSLELGEGSEEDAEALITYSEVTALVEELVSEEFSGVLSAGYLTVIMALAADWISANQDKKRVTLSDIRHDLAARVFDGKDSVPANSSIDEAKVWLTSRLRENGADAPPVISKPDKIRLDNADSAVCERIKRVKRLTEIGAPGVIMQNERRMLNGLLDTLNGLIAGLKSADGVAPYASKLAEYTREVAALQSDK